MNPKPNDQQKREAYTEELEKLTLELEQRIKRIKRMVDGLRKSL